jgi:translocator protein
MDYPALIGFAGACVGAAAMGSLFPVGDWYRGLNKPSWTPKNWVFPVVWTTLYVLIAWAAMRVAGLPGSGAALGLWSLQMVLNAIWTPIFFGLRRLALGFVVISLLWLTVAATCLLMFRLDLWAGLMFLPYLVWLSIASALNWSVWRMNPGVEPVQMGG